jgi:hypothetical protein
VTATNYNNINKTTNFHLKSLKTKMTMKYGFENPSLGFRTGTVKPRTWILTTNCACPKPGVGFSQPTVPVLNPGLGFSQRIQVLV